MDQKSEQNDKLEDDSKTNLGKKTCHCPPSNLIGGQAKTELREKKKVKRLTKFDCKTVDVTPFFIYLLTLHLNQSQNQGSLIDNQKNCCQTSTLLLKKIIEKLATSVQQAPCGKCNNKNCRKGTDKCCGCGAAKKARITHEKCFQEFDQKYGDFHSKLSAFLDKVGSESKDNNEDKENNEGSENKGSKGGKGSKGSKSSKEEKQNDPDSTNPTISQPDNVEQGKEHRPEQPHCICGGNLYSFKGFAPEISIGSKNNAIECRSELQEKHANCFCPNRSQNKQSRFKSQPHTLGKVCSSSSDRPHYLTQQNSWKQQHMSQLKVCNSRSQQEVSEMRKKYCNCSSNEQLKKIIDAIIKECASEGVLKDKLMNCLNEKLNPRNDPSMLPNKDVKDNQLMPPQSGKKCLHAESVEAIVHKEVEKLMNENGKFANETKQNKLETATDPKPCKYEESDHPPTIFQKCLKCGCSTKRVPEGKKLPNPQNAPNGTSDVYYFLNQETTLPKVNDKLDEKLLKSSSYRSDTLQSPECQRPVNMCKNSPSPKCSESPEKMQIFAQNGSLSCNCAPNSNFSQMLERESKEDYNKCVVTDQTNKTSLLASYDDLAFKAKQLEYQQQQLIQQQKALLEQKLQQQKQQEQIQQQLLELQQQQLHQQLIYQQLQQQQLQQKMQKQQIPSQQMREQQMEQQKIPEHFPHNLLRQQYQTQHQHMQQLQPIKECWEPSPDKQQLGYDINANNDQWQSNNTSSNGKGRFDFESPKQVIDPGEKCEQAFSQNDPCYTVTKAGKLNRNDSIELETEYNLESKQDSNCQTDEFSNNSNNDQNIDVKPDFMQQQNQSKTKSKPGFFSMFSTQPARKECVEVKITACPPLSNQEAQCSKNLRPKKLLNDEECYRKTETLRRISFDDSPRNSCESSLYSRYFGFFKQKFEGKGENCEKSETSSKSGNSESSAKNDDCEQLDNRENCEQLKKRENCQQLFEKRENCEQFKKRDNCQQLFEKRDNCQQFKTRENCQQLFEKRENCQQLFEKRENCEQFKKRENCQQLFEKRENCQQLFEKRENCEQLKEREYCEQLKQRENYEQLKKREYCEQLLKQKENCEQLKKREYCEQLLKQKENCEQLKKREYCEQLKQREYCEQLKLRENCEQLKKREYCEQLKQRENCERLARCLKRVPNNNCENTGLQISKIKVHCNNRNNMPNQEQEFHPELQPHLCSKDIETFEKCSPSHEQPPIYYSIQNKGWSRANPPKWKAIDDVIARKSITSESESSACNGNRLTQHRPSSCDPVQSYSYQRNNIAEDFTGSNYNNCNANSTNMNSEGHKASSISDISDTFIRAKFRERNLSNSSQCSRRRMYMNSRQWAMQPSRKIRDKRVNPVLIELSNKNLQQNEKVDPNSPSAFTPDQGKEGLFQRALSTITEVDNENIGPNLSEQQQRYLNFF